MSRRQRRRSWLWRATTDVRGEDRRVYPFFLLLARTGLRLSQAFALGLAHLDLDGREIRAAEAFSHGRIADGATRECEMLDLD